MTIDIDKLRAELRASVKNNDPKWPLPINLGEATALLDHIDRLEAQVVEIQQDCVDIHTRAEAAEAELARLRAPAEGEVGALVATLQADGAVYCTDAADLLQRLSAQVAELERDYQLIKECSDHNAKKGKAAEARLAEAVEVMRSCRASYVENDDASALERIIDNIDAFLAKLENPNAE